MTNCTTTETPALNNTLDYENRTHHYGTFTWNLNFTVSENATDPNRVPHQAYTSTASTRTRDSTGTSPLTIGLPSPFTNSGEQITVRTVSFGYTNNETTTTTTTTMEEKNWTINRRYENTSLEGSGATVVSDETTTCTIWNESYFYYFNKTGINFCINFSFSKWSLPHCLVEKCARDAILMSKHACQYVNQCVWLCVFYNSSITNAFSTKIIW